MKTLITGAAGFIGMNCALRLLDRDDEVIGIDNLNDYYDPKLKKDRLDYIDKFVANRGIDNCYQFIKLDIIYIESF